MDEQDLRIDQEGINMDANQDVKMTHVWKKKTISKREKITIGHESSVVIVIF